MKAVAYALMLAALLTGCARMRASEPSASPPTLGTGDKVTCESSGGKWNAFTRNCDR
jgi:hypothetical protein